jgi:hypothetical protein
MYINGNLVKDRQDDLMRTAARCRLAARARQARAPQRHHVRAVPARLLAGIRAGKAPA